MLFKRSMWTDMLAPAQFLGFPRCLDLGSSTLGCISSQAVAQLLPRMPHLESCIVTLPRQAAVDLWSRSEAPHRRLYVDLWLHLLISAWCLVNHSMPPAGDGHVRACSAWLKTLARVSTACQLIWQGKAA